MSTETPMPARTDALLSNLALWRAMQIAFLALCFVVLSAAGAGCGCAHNPASYAREASAQELQSVVTLAAPSVEWREPALSSSGFGTRMGSAALTYTQYCNAFAVARPADGGRITLVTAAHCLARAKLGVGDEASYEAPSGWEHARARVVLVDVGRDYAELDPGTTVSEGELVPLAQGAAPREGAFLSTPSSLYGESVSGRAYSVAPGKVAFYGWAARGWSGSPVLDTNGRVVGVVIRCVLSAGPGSPCANGVIAGLL
jgi:hypothetical protein